MARADLLRRTLPWWISVLALGYVFGYATDWKALLAATRGADLTTFVLLTTLDKLVFFFVWARLQAEAICRFVAPVSKRSILAIRGGSELLRTVSNPLADAAFLLGVARLTGGRLDAVVVVALIPFVTHLMVLLAQATLSIFFLEGGFEQHGEVMVTAGLGWALVGATALALRMKSVARLPGLGRIVHWLDRVHVSRLLPFFAAFVGLAAFDVLIQGLASRAFGVPIPWLDLTARIPLLYLALAIPSVGNFGVREFAWAELFHEAGPTDSLYAFAFATNAVFLLLNVLIGILFLRRALELVAEVRRSRRSGEPLPEPLLHDATDP